MSKNETKLNELLDRLVRKNEKKYSQKRKVE